MLSRRGFLSAFGAVLVCWRAPVQSAAICFVQGWQVVRIPLRTEYVCTFRDQQQPMEWR